MKKLVVSLILLAVLLLSACDYKVESNEGDIDQNRFSSDSRNNIDIITDSETGCKYLFVKRNYGGGLTPLLDENGEFQCGK